jgi:NAD(P)-dependent dehydrogenase (short-subunit alcohol dehydrogenase family)
VGIDTFRYDGKRALVVGGATGMGAAAAKIVADLGGEVVVMDYADVGFPVAQAIKVDLRDQAQMDAAIDECGGPIHALFSCAGIADGPDVMRINFNAHRHIIDRLLSSGLMPRGSAIAMISSAAGLGWERNLPTLLDFLDTTDFDAANAWVAKHDGTDNYMFAKQAMNAYVARQALPLMKQGIRINSILPGPTDTPLARANAEVWLGFGTEFRAAAGTEYLTPEEMANPLVFLNSDAASGINGIQLVVDHGQVGSVLSGAFEDVGVAFLLGTAEM